MFAPTIPDLAVLATLATPLLITLWTDLRSRLVSPLVILPGLLAALAIAARGPLGWPDALLGGAGAAGVTALLVALARWFWPEATETPLGSGDVLLAALIGATFGPQQAPAVLFMGAIAGAGAAGGLLLTRRARRDEVIPYGVFLCGAALVALALTPNPSPVEPGEGSLAPKHAAILKPILTSTLPSPRALGDSSPWKGEAWEGELGLGVRELVGEEPGKLAVLPITHHPSPITLATAATNRQTHLRRGRD